MYWEEKPPSYLFLGITKGWENETHRFSFRKELGINFQYSGISHISGGLGACWNQYGNVGALFADVSLLANYRISQSLRICMGPQAEFLVMGFHHLFTNSSSNYMNPPYSYHSNVSKINREYFNKPSYGIQVQIVELNPNKKAVGGIAISYLWTESNEWNFYASNYMRISFFIRVQKERKKMSGLKPLSEFNKSRKTML